MKLIAIIRMEHRAAVPRKYPNASGLVVPNTVIS
jgi:hypothetical protein